MLYYLYSDRLRGTHAVLTEAVAALGGDPQLRQALRVADANELDFGALLLTVAALAAFMCLHCCL